MRAQRVTQSTVVLWTSSSQARRAWLQRTTPLNRDQARRTEAGTRVEQGRITGALSPNTLNARLHLRLRARARLYAARGNTRQKRRGTRRAERKTSPANLLPQLRTGGEPHPLRPTISS